MITTRFGSEVKILQKPDFGNFVRVKRIADGAVRDWHRSELRETENGEIEKAISEAGPAPQGNSGEFHRTGIVA